MAEGNAATAKSVLTRLNEKANPANVAGMRRFGISGKKMLGVSVTELRQMAKTIPKNHTLALSLWKSGVHEARILASILDEPEKVTSTQMDAWICDFDSWDVCDQVCGNL
ncbi:MAG: DNA alkylation repair protein, partial [Candidatus Micrarchaeota archaeon]|nr:DNA alkylation repair protein [Candidatus Micrarchaeota archaeon]